MGSVYFQEPSIDGAPGIWALDDALRYQALGKWPTIPATVPNWVKRGPDGALPVDQADYALGKGWYNGQPHPNLFAYIDAAGGTFSRGSDASYFDSAGVLRTAGSNVLRLDHDPATGKVLGARMEGAGTNLAINSGGRSGAVGVIGAGGALPTYWSVAAALGLTVEVLATNVDPMIGGCRLRVYGVTAVSGNFRMQCSSGVARTVEQAGVVASCFVRGVSGALPGQPVITLVNANAGHVAPFDPFDATSLSKARRLGTGAGTVSSPLAIRQELRFFVATGVAVDFTIEIGGAQLEEASFPSSYVETTSAAAQRLADSLTFARAAPPEGTVVIEARSPLGTGGNQVLWQWDDGTDANRYRLVRVNDGNLRAIMTVAGVDEVNLDLGPVANDADLKVVSSWRAGQFAASLNGAAAVVDTAYTGPLPVVSTVRCGSGATSGDEWFGAVARIGIFDRTYDPSQLPEAWA